MRDDVIPVLLYHSVSDSPAPEIADFTVTVDEFAGHVARIAESGREAVSLSELARRLAAGEAAAAELVCVTFDDGWHDNIAAAQVLAAHSLPATIYVTSGYVGRPGMVDDAGLRALADTPGIEIGAHSIAHPHLDELPLSAAAHEIAGSKAALEQALGRPVESFAYPHGAYDRRVRQAVIDAGFSSAAAVKNALSHPADDRFAIARWTLHAGAGDAQFASVLAGRGAPLAWGNERLRTKGYRAVRKLRRRASGQAA